MVFSRETHSRTMTLDSRIQPKPLDLKRQWSNLTTKMAKNLYEVVVRSGGCRKRVKKKRGNTSNVEAKGNRCRERERTSKGWVVALLRRRIKQFALLGLEKEYTLPTNKLWKWRGLDSIPLSFLDPFISPVLNPTTLRKISGKGIEIKPNQTLSK